VGCKGELVNVYSVLVRKGMYCVRDEFFYVCSVLVRKVMF
jgi:hypothetical protein